MFAILGLDGSCGFPLAILVVFEDASHFDTVQFRHSAISTQKRHFDTETLQKVSHFDTVLDVSTHFLTNAYLCLFMGFHYMDFVLIDLKIP